MTKYVFNKFQWYFIQFICWAVLFNSFVLFEETIIDRSNLWKSIPGYRVGNPCVWDLTAAILFAILVFFVFRKRK
jgi:hypothetical protein